MAPKSSHNPSLPGNLEFAVCFNVLIGESDTGRIAAVSNIGMAISVPCRKSRYENPVHPKRKPDHVSIPYRKSRYKTGTFRNSANSALFQFLIGSLNTQILSHTKIRRAVFQFLIGSLNTFQHLVGQPFQMEFQFLIGSLNTDVAADDTEYLDMFQFLIGSLNTIQTNPKSRRHKTVSIPYRKSRYSFNALRFHA